MNPHEQPCPGTITFVPDYPHSVMRISFPDETSDSGKFLKLDERLCRFCTEHHLCISFLPQWPHFMIRIEGLLSLVDGSGGSYVIRDRHVPFRYQEDHDLLTLRDALVSVCPACKKGVIQKVVGGFPENRDPSIVNGFRLPDGLVIDGLRQFRLDRRDRMEGFSGPHLDPDNESSVNEYMLA